VGSAVLIQFRIAQAEVAFGRMIFRRGEFAMQLVGADIGRVLVSHSMRIKGFVGNREYVLAWVRLTLSDSEGVFTCERFSLEAYELDDDVVTHWVPEIGFLSRSPLQNLIQNF